MQREYFELIEQICIECDEGYGFVPLIGSGLSVISGIPTMREVQEYLYLCLRLALKKKWKPQSSKWHRIEDIKEVFTCMVSEEPTTMLEWIKNEVIRLEEIKSLAHNNYIHWEAIGALADWRTTLQFLSRLEFHKNDIFLGKPDNSVIDSFFFHITKDKKPNIGHLMLGHLADALRIRTLLTTNFDPLLEDAFAQLDMPLSTFDVHQNTELPTPGLVLEQRSIIKLHGGRYGLLANFALDEIPSEYNKKTFCRYFSDQTNHKFKETRKHLLVLGTSGSDRRTINLIKCALDNVTDLKVFWICHAAHEKQINLNEFLKYADRVKTSIHVDIGQFLIQLYQQLYLSPPPGRMDFPAFWPTHPSPYTNKKQTMKNNFTNEKDKISQEIEDLMADPNKSGLIVYGEAGITSLAAYIAEEFAENYECIWFTLNIFNDWNDFFLTLIDTISWRLGIPPATLPKSINNPEACGKRLNQLLKHTSRKFILFLNDREGKGIKSGQKWDEKSLELFQTVIGTTEGQIANLMFILLTQKKNDWEFPAHWKSFSQYHLKKKVIEFDAKKIAKKVRKFIESKSNDTREKRIRFVYALTLFEHAAYLPALCSWSLIKAPNPFADEKDNDQIRSGLRNKWLTKLKDIGAVRYNAGGFVWMHKGVRDEIRKRLDSEVKPYRAECHQGIADWYVKLFRSSNDPLAALESLKHRLHCIEYADDLDSNAGCG
ncbi:MAG: SIR2 family protein, partial [Planctomycetota bacterium]